MIESTTKVRIQQHQMGLIGCDSRHDVRPSRNGSCLASAVTERQPGDLHHERLIKHHKYACRLVSGPRSRRTLDRGGVGMQFDQSEQFGDVERFAQERSHARSR